MLTNMDIASNPSPTKATEKRGSLFSFLFDFADLNSETHLLANDAANKLKKGKD